MNEKTSSICATISWKNMLHINHVSEHIKNEADDLAMNQNDNTN